MSEQLIQTPGVFGDNGNFLLERELGSGGMGGVYMGRDKMLDRPVAVKVMLRELGADAEFVEKFKKEAQAAARLVHPNIVQIYSYGISDGMPYIAMELAPGGSLFSMMSVAPGKTDIQRALKICQQTAQALQCATDQGVIHGDVKPENILLDANGNAKLVDFGLSAMQKDTDEIWGTPYYIAPEKVKKDIVDFRADMYSLGATLYHALTGVAPFEGDDSIAVVKKRFEGAPRNPSEIRPEISPAVDELVMKMIALEKEDRYPSFESLIQAFTEALASGLTQKNERPVQTPRTSSEGGTRRTTSVKTRRTMIKRPTHTAATKVELPDVGEDEEDSGNLGAKVAMFVVGGILAIGAVVGGLVWFIAADKKARQEEFQTQVVSKMTEARKSIATTRKMTSDFDKEFLEFSAQAVTSCTKLTAQLAELLPDFADQMKPPVSVELKKAIALTNVTAEVSSSMTNSSPAATVASAVSTADTAPRKRMTLQEEAVKYGLEPPSEDFDPASPDGEAFLARLKEARAKAAASQASSEQKTISTTKADSCAAASGDSKKGPPYAVKEINELWDRAYSCQAGQIKIALQIKNIISECDKADAIVEQTEASAKALGDISLTVKDLYEKMTGSQDVANVRKAIGLINQKGGKMLKRTRDEITIAKAQQIREETLANQKKLDEERAAEAAKKRAELVQKETSEIALKFDAIATSGCFRQLDWKSAIRQLENAAEFYKTPEGQLAKELQVKKVNDMKMVQDLFIARLKGHVFKGKLKNHIVIAVDEKSITIQKNEKNAKKPTKIDWQKFYKDYPGNFNEIINQYIVQGRRTCNLNLREWADTMTGVALTMRLVCSEVDGATAKAEMLAKEVVKQFPDYQKTMKQIFPDLTFEDASDE